MARIVNPAGVPANPVIEGNITATTAVTTEGTGAGAHTVSATTDTNSHTDSLVIAGDYGSIDVTRVSDSGWSTLYAGSSNTDGLGNIVGSSINGHSATINADVDVSTGAEYSEVAIASFSPVSSNIILTSQTNSLPGPINLNGEVVVSGSLNVEGYDVTGPKKRMYLFDDFAQGITGLGVSSSAQGDSGFVSPSPTDTGRIGIQGQKTGTGTTNAHTVGMLANNMYRIGYGYDLIVEAGIKIPVLSDGTNSFSVHFGLGTWGQSGNNASQTNLAKIIYSANSTSFTGTSSANWQTRTNNASDTVNTGLAAIPVTTNWVNLKVAANAAGTEVKFYIDNVLLATHTANIPSNTESLQAYLTIEKSAGTTSREVWMDYFAVTCDFPTSR